MKKTQIKFEWNKVTTFSKYLALAMFVALPFIGFVLGMKYQSLITTYQSEYGFDSNEKPCLSGEKQNHHK